MANPLSVEDKEQKRLYSRDYYRKNRELVKQKWAAYRKAHPEIIKAGSINYSLRNEAVIKQRSKTRREALRKETFNAYGGKCSLCGESRQEFLCIDHVYNNGKEDREKFGGSGVILYSQLRKQGFPKNGYRVLCYNCNMARMLKEKMSVPQLPKQVKYTRKVKSELLEAYGKKCACCGEDNPVLLVIDHINGNGQADRSLKGRGRAMYAHLKKLGYPRGEYRLLCHNCNMSLGFFGYCPHDGVS